MGCTFFGTSVSTQHIVRSYPVPLCGGRHLYYDAIPKPPSLLLFEQAPWDYPKYSQTQSNRIAI